MTDPAVIRQAVREVMGLTWPEVVALKSDRDALARQVAALRSALVAARDRLILVGSGSKHVLRDADVVGQADATLAATLAAARAWEERVRAEEWEACAKVAEKPEAPPT